MSMTERKRIVDRLLRFKGWPKLNKVQKKALDEGILELEDNFVIIAPTASGKTGIAELAMLQKLENKGKIIYTVPTNALINAKLEEFEYLKKLYNVKKGVGTSGQWKNADLVITTFESLYRACLRSKHFLNDFRLVVVDEFHILYSAFRGYTLEKALTILKESNIRIFCLSATFEDRREIGEWLNAKVVYIHRSLRPIPIIHDVIDLRNSGETLHQALGI